MKPIATFPRSDATSSLPPDSVCGYNVLRALGPQTYLAVADGGRHVVLKPLDGDCLLQGQLHPSIKERLARVRELAFKGVANLHGVERDERGVFLVWEFIEGRTFEEFASSPETLQLAALTRELVLAVESLHAQGLIHGGLHARNVIVDSAGRPRMTHVSPLLYHDAAVDESAVLSMLGELIDKRALRDSPLGKAINAGVAQRIGLRQLATNLVTLPGAEREVIVDGSKEDDRKRRRRTLLWALAVAAFGGLLTLAAWAWVQKTLTPPGDVPGLDAGTR